MPSIRHSLVLGLAAVATTLPHLAGAHLGGPSSSVAIDRSRMAARLNTVTAARFARHEMTRPNGGTVHEFTNAAGVVFAVTWSGPGKPDLATLLGPYFQTFQASSVATARRMHSLRQPVRVADPDLQIQVGGHMGWFHGVAYIPSLAPAGFDVADLAVQP